MAYTFPTTIGGVTVEYNDTADLATAWAAYSNKDLVSQNKIVCFRLTANQVFAAVLSLNAWTTDATRFVWVTADAGNALSDQDPATVPLQYNTSYRRCNITATVGRFFEASSGNPNKFLRVSRMQLHSTNSTGRAVYYSDLGGTVELQNCLVALNNAQEAISVAGSGTTTVRAVNCVYVNARTTDNFFATWTNASIVQMENVTQFNPSSSGGTGGAKLISKGGSNSPGSYVRNCILVGASGDFPLGTTTTLDADLTWGAIATNAGDRSYTGGTALGANTWTMTPSANLTNVTSVSVYDMRLQGGAPIIGTGLARSSLSTNEDFFHRERKSTGALSPGAFETLLEVSSQIAAPTSTISAGPWTAVGAASLHGALSESAASDTEYAVTASSGPFEVALGTLSSPQAGTRTVRYRLQSTSGANMQVDLVQGTTVIQTWNHTPAPGAYTTYEQTVTEAVTNYADLRLRFTAS